MILTKEEVMKRLLRGDFDTLHKLGNNDYVNTASIYWGMRQKGWNRMDTGGVYKKRPIDADRFAMFTEESSEWRKDLMDVLETLGYALSHINQ